MSCAQWIRYEPIKASFMAMMGVFIGLYVASFSWQYETARAPGDPQLIGPIAVADLPSGYHALSLDMRLPYNGNCTREGFYQLRSEPPGNGRPRFYPLGGFVNGTRFASMPEAYGVDFLLPPNLHGEWRGTLRLYYSCPPLMLTHFTSVVDLGPVHLP